MPQWWRLARRCSSWTGCSPFNASAMDVLAIMYCSLRRRKRRCLSGRSKAQNVSYDQIGHWLYGVQMQTRCKLSGCTVERADVLIRAALVTSIATTGSWRLRMETCSHYSAPAHACNTFIIFGYVAWKKLNMHKNIPWLNDKFRTEEFK